jgi:hypothetical protein
MNSFELMAFLKIGNYIINEDDITAISEEDDGGRQSQYVIRLRGSEKIVIHPAEEAGDDAKKLLEKYSALAESVQVIIRDESIGRVKLSDQT